MTLSKNTNILLIFAIIVIFIIFIIYKYATGYHKFGDKIGTASVDHPYPENIGAHQLKAGNDVRVLTIDSFCVDNCDFIQLDIEGYEHLALLGAEKTIKKTYPVITLELKGLGSRYGYTDEDTINLLQDWGYEIVGRVNRDVIFARY